MKRIFSLTTLVVLISVSPASHAAPLTLEDVNSLKQVTAARYDYSLRPMRWMDHYLKAPGGQPPLYELDHAERLESSAEE